MALRDEFQYYLDHQAELAAQYEGKVIVIKDHRVIGAYASEIEAIRQTTKKHALGTFLVQPCSSDPESTLQTYHSRSTTYYGHTPSHQRTLSAVGNGAPSVHFQYPDSQNLWSSW